MKILEQTLKKKWFDMIASGIKTDEYREIKPFWVARLVDKNFAWDCKTAEDIKYHLSCCPNGFFKKFDAVRFKNGYASNAPEILMELKGIEIRTGRPEWGAEKGTEYFVEVLGKIISKGL